MGGRGGENRASRKKTRPLLANRAHFGITMPTFWLACSAVAASSAVRTVEWFGGAKYHLSLLAAAESAAPGILREAFPDKF